MKLAPGLSGWLFFCAAFGTPGTLAAQGPAPVAPAPTVLTRHLSRTKALADLQLFQDIQEKANAGLYKYRSKTQLDSAFAAVRTQAAYSLTLLAFYKLLVGLTDFAGSLPSDTLLPDSATSALRRQTAFFPFPVKWVAGHPRLGYRDSQLALALKLLAGPVAAPAK